MHHIFLSKDTVGARLPRRPQMAGEYIATKAPVDSYETSLLTPHLRILRDSVVHDQDLAHLTSSSHLRRLACHTTDTLSEKLLSLTMIYYRLCFYAIHSERIVDNNQRSSQRQRVQVYKRGFALIE